MFRVSRRSWLAQFFGRRAAAAKEKPVGTGRAKVKWDIHFVGPRPITVLAFTKSEARAMVKKELGLKSRLPVGAYAVRNGRKASSEAA